MSEQIHDVLHDAAAPPRRSVDVDGLMARARRRRQRLGAVVASSALVVASMLAVVVVRSGDNGATVNAAVAGEGSNDVPPPADGWKRVDAPDAGLTIDVPEAWYRLDPEATQRLYGEVLVVGNSDSYFDDAPPPCSVATPSDAPSTWVALHEISANTAGLVERPTRFAIDDSTYSTFDPCPADVTGTPEQRLRRGVRFEFLDHGRAFVATITENGGVEGAGLKVGVEVLDTLRVSALVTPTTKPAETSNPTTTTRADPAPTTSTTPEVTTPISADDEAAVRATINDWLQGAPPGMNLAVVEDGAGIADAVAKAVAYRQAQGLPGFRRADPVGVADRCRPRPCST